VVQLRQFASEVTRVSLEVGTEGKLGGVAVVEGVEGVWHELTVNVCWRELPFVGDQLTRSPTGQPDVSKSYTSSAINCACHNRCRSGIYQQAPSS